MTLFITLLHGGLWDVIIGLFVGALVFAFVFVAPIAFITHLFVKREQKKQESNE